MLNKKQIDDHLIALRIACESPFKGMVSFKKGLLSLPIPEQHQVYNAMSSELKEMVFDS